MNDDLGDRIAGRALPGAVYFRFQQWDEYAAPTDYWMFDNPATVLHEVLHQSAWRYGLTDGDVWLEEGLTEAVTMDLMPAYLRRLGALQNTGLPTYKDSVNAVRKASARATCRSWRSHAARRWRMRLIATRPSERILYPSMSVCLSG